MLQATAPKPPSSHRGASPQTDAACPQVNTPGVPVRTQGETRAYQSGTEYGSMEAAVGAERQPPPPQKLHRVFLDTALEGITGAPAPPPSPLQSCCLVIKASGGEFRVVLHNDEGETRYGAPCLVIAFGQDENSRSAMGLGNPCEQSALRVTTSDKKMLVARGTPDSVKTWWVLLDAETGWVHAGAGAMPGFKTAMLGMKLRDRRHLSWSHVSFSNWRERVDLSCSFAAGVQFGGTWAGGNPMQKARAKFDQFCRMRRFEGLTTVIHHGPEQRLHQVMRALCGLLHSNPLLAPHFALLPPSSFHVTCMGLLTYEEEFLQAHGYNRSAGLGHRPTVNESLAACNAAVNECWALLPPTLTFVPDLRRRVNNSVKLEALDEVALAKWREAVAERIHAKHMVPSSPGYIHHSTFAYQIYPITSNEAAAAWEAYNEAAICMLASVPPFTLTRPELCTFRDMAEFIPVPAGARPTLEPVVARAERARATEAVESAVPMEISTVWEDELGEAELQRGWRPCVGVREVAGQAEPPPPQLSVPDSWEVLAP